MAFVTPIPSPDSNKTMQHLSALHILDATPPLSRVVVIDRQRLSRECLVQVLGQFAVNKWDVQSFPTLSDAIEANDDHPLLAVVYIHQDLAQEIEAVIHCADGQDIGLLIVTDQPNESLASLARHAIRSGVRGLLSTAEAGSKILHSAIDFILNGGTFISPELLLEPPAPAKPPAKSILTDRQAQVFAKLKEGKPNKIIAYELGMSESTTKVHVRNIMTKLGVSNRTQAAFVGSAQF